jgi:hypothetical protein
MTRIERINADLDIYFIIAFSQRRDGRNVFINLFN